MAAAGEPGGPPSDRGRRRRDALVAAAADVLLDDGFAGVTHRSVAARAGLPLAATTYYFASLDDLRDAATRSLADSWLDRARAVVDRLPGPSVQPAAAARALVALVAGEGANTAPQPQELITMYERYLQAGRHPRLRPLVAQHNQQLTGLAAQILRRCGLPGGDADARLALAVVDGALITALAEGRPPVAAGVRAVSRLLRAEVPRSTARAGR